jgi:hypothetical protein
MHEEGVPQVYDDDEKFICENCNGSGLVIDPETGEVIKDPVCNGNGWVSQSS